MIRSTLNESLKTVKRDNIHLSVGIELGLNDSGVVVELTESAWDSLVTPPSPIRSHEHWDGTGIQR